MELKEYTIKITKKGDELVKWSGGEFITCNIEGDWNGKTTKFGIPKLKKDGTVTKAYESIQKVGIGDTISAKVDEKEKKGENGTYLVRTIRFIEGDEHGTPHTSQPVSEFKKGIAEEHVVALSKKVEGLERRVTALEGGSMKEVPNETAIPTEIPNIDLEDDIKAEDLPF